MPDDIKTRMLAIAEQMRELAVELDAHATRVDAKPDGYSDAYRAIVTARDLGALAMRISAAAREMADG